MAKPKVAIYDFTDCEGCEVRLLSVKEKLLDMNARMDIINWRLTQDSFVDGPYDITIIEGTPITKMEVELLKELRENSRKILTLGACASIAGVPGIMDFSERKKWYDTIYGAGYKPRGIDALPVSAYVRVDHMLHGCPVDLDELIRTIEELLAGKTPRYRSFSVCFECKIAGNPCRLLEDKICFGPITQGGCKAVCVSGGSPCYGCFGMRDEGNILALVRILKWFASPKEIRSHLTMFFNQIPELKAAFDSALRKKTGARP